ncbi:MAG: O-acetyl-ADP-ribose deacetylase [Rubripirellula sp.]
MNDLANRVVVVDGDITRLKTDAVVTAANSQLRGGGGVDGAVHAAAGPELLEASLKLAPCPPGEARITPAFRLPATWVIHAVGPIYRDGKSAESVTLASAYQASLECVREHQLKSIAFPCISTGVYGYPKDEAAEIAIKTVLDWLRLHVFPHQVIFCCFDARDARRYRDELSALGFSEKS